MQKVFGALSDPTRRAILELLRDQDLTAGEIAAHFSISKPSISHHLSLLKQADLVLDAREGQYIRYRLNTTVLDDLLSWFLTFRGGQDVTENERNDENES